MTGRSPFGTPVGWLAAAGRMKIEQGQLDPDRRLIKI